MPPTEDQSLAARVLDWLRAGYPAGVPREDYIALAGVLHRTLTEAEVDALSAELAASGHATSDAEIAQLIQARIHEHAEAPDVARVSSRLAQGGWPLAVPSQVEDTPLEETGRIQRIVDWLREGYPSGVPATEFIPLVALLRRRLSDQEVKQVAKSLRKAEIAPVGPVEIGVEIARVTREMPSAEDIRRVHDRLAKKGWPLEFPDPL
ncbi:MAG: DUF3349 domain-containing protein [Tetrasphaera sp.]